MISIMLLFCNPVEIYVSESESESESNTNGGECAPKLAISPALRWRSSEREKNLSEPTRTVSLLSELSV